MFCHWKNRFYHFNHQFHQKFGDTIYCAFLTFLAFGKHLTADLQRIIRIFIFSIAQKCRKLILAL
jgi:hypothetical protein